MKASVLEQTSSAGPGQLRSNSRRAIARLGERLVSDGIIRDDQLEQALQKQKHSGGFLAQILVSSGVVAPLAIRNYLEEMTGFPFIDLSEIEIDREIASQIPEGFAIEKKVLAVKEIDGRILIAMSDPLNLATIDDLKGRFAKPIVPGLAFEQDVFEAIKRTYDVRFKTRFLLDEIGSTNAPNVNDPASEIMEDVDGAPIVRLINGILEGAISAGASDIHFEPQPFNVRVRYRIDGILYEQMTVPSSHQAACVSRLKVMSGMDISEKRRPQDARFSTRDEAGHEYDARVSTMPTAYGEKVCMRLLEKSNSVARLDRLGFLPEQRDMYEKFIRRPFGLILVTGPTGSGKSTSLYAALQILNDPAVNINTIEDPIEYKIAGINQMQTNPKAGVTFASGLRTLVRQDPDIILVGEIRDSETAEISVQAALTGHIVLSSLHTNDAPGALVRLQNMGVERFLIASSVVGVVAQRLLRTICPNCKETYTPSPDLLRSLGIPEGDDFGPVTLARGVGCRRCSGRGTVGRTAAAELFFMTEAMRNLMLAGCSATQLTNQAIEDGMIPMKQIAVRKALDHAIPAEEVFRVFAQED